MPTRKRKKNILPHRYWTKQEEALLLRYYVNKGPDWCATALSAKGLDRTKVAVENRAHKMGLYYCGEPIGRYKKGHVPASKGKKMSPEQYERCKATMFKPGDRPENRVPIGHETIRNDGYTYVKVAEKKWVFKHRLLWEKQNGPVPAANDLPATGGQVQVTIPGVDGGIFTEITNGLLTSFREIQGSKDPKFLKEAGDRARAKVQVSRAITDIAKTVISAKKNR